jgi:hypothetical protein
LDPLQAYPAQAIQLLENDGDMDESGNVTRLLREWSDGHPSAFDELMPIIYAELHRQAGRYLRNERRYQTLQTTALINEAYVRLVGQTGIS